jgi:uncharacterized protein involved in exopolysaccharide biosynthesis
MEIAQIIRALRNYWGITLVLCASAVLSSIASTYVVSEAYKSITLVMVRPQEDLDLSLGTKTKGVLNFPLPALVPFEAISQTYSEIIKSRAVAERIVRALNLDQEAAEQGWWKRFRTKVKNFFFDAWTFLKYGRIEAENAFEGAVAGVQRSISVTPTRDTYVFEIAFQGKDPRVAATVVNMATVVFAEYIRDLSKKEATLARQSLKEQLERSEQELERARTALQQFKDRNQIVLLEKEATTQITTLSGFQIDLENARKDVRGVEAEIRGLRAQLATQSEFVKSSTTVADNPLVTDLKSELAKLEIELASLSQRLTPAHPKIIALDASIDHTRTRLAEEVGRTLSDETSKINSVYQTLLQDRLQAEAKLESLRAKEVMLAATVKRQQDFLREYPEKQSRLDQLETDLTLAQNTHKALSHAHDEARIREGRSSGDVTVVAPGTAPAYPEKPVKIYYAGVSLFIALMAGVALALVREAVNMRLRSVEDAERALQLPVLATLPLVEWTRAREPSAQREP